MRRTRKSLTLKTNEIVSEDRDSSNISIFAVFGVTAPLARGRYFLVGCALSSFISIRSLNM